VFGERVWCEFVHDLAERLVDELQFVLERVDAAGEAADDRDQSLLGRIAAGAQPPAGVDELVAAAVSEPLTQPGRGSHDQAVQLVERRRARLPGGASESLCMRVSCVV